MKYEGGQVVIEEVLEVVPTHSSTKSTQGRRSFLTLA
jgi:hypothetical protein